MNKFQTVGSLSQHLAKLLRMREWRIDQAISKDDLLTHIEYVQKYCEVAKEIAKEMILP